MAVALELKESPLRVLSLWSNDISDAGAIKLADALAVNTSLTTLDLAGNSIGEAGADRLTAAVARNRSLASLDLRNNDVDARDPKAAQERRRRARKARRESMEHAAALAAEDRGVPARGGPACPLIINRSADGTPIFSFVGLGTDGSLGADGSQCDAPLPARRRKKVLPLMSYRRKKRADDEAWGAPAARRRPAPAPAHPVMDYNNWTRDLERDSAAGPAAPDPASRRGPGSSPPGTSPEPSPTRASKRAAKLERMRDLERENARLERLKFDAPRPRRPRTRRCPPSSPSRRSPRARASTGTCPRPARPGTSRLRPRRRCRRRSGEARQALAEHAPEAPPEEEEIPVLERMRRAAAERDEAARRRANAAAKKLSPKKKPALKKSVAPANLSPPKPGAACRARAAARAAREQREAGLAAGDEFLEAQMKRMAVWKPNFQPDFNVSVFECAWASAARSVERKHRYARALEKPSGYDARRKATPPAPPELHLANHERLLKKYERSLVASNGLEGDRLCRIQIFNSTSIRIDLDLTELENSQVWSGPPKPVVEFGTGDRTPLAEDLTPYRALVSLAPEAFEMDPATGAAGAAAAELRRRPRRRGRGRAGARFREIMA
ncbi:peptide-aspartate beta-dioxygenase [Aureococcus anophagefferens]|nr:peptide-aspartate beta-dioxygenase [Aureococcus anophagefferens]